MRAFVYQPSGVTLTTVPDPVPADGEVLVTIEAISLNSAEVHYLDEQRQPGEIPGWDAAGTVVQTTENGPPVGARVVTFGWAGAWAQLRAVPTTELAVLPDTVTAASASALPVAAVTALRAVRRLGAVLGKRVLVTGASGGVGRFAVQLAGLAGAHVIAVVGSPERGAGLVELGAAEIVTTLEGLEPVYGVLDNVDGPQLVSAFGLLEPEGVAIAVGSASGELPRFDLEAARRTGGGMRLEVFYRGERSADDLAYLVGLLAAGKLDPQIGWQGDWEDLTDAMNALRERRVAGKAVLQVS